MKRFVVVVCVVVLVLAACSSSGGNGDGGEDFAEIESEESDEDGDSSVDDETLDAAQSLGQGVGELDDDAELCLAQGLASNEGLLSAALDDAEFSELDPDQQVLLFQIVIDCAPDAVAEGIADGIQQGSDLDDEQARCLADELVGLGPSTLQAFAEADIRGTEPSTESIASLIDIFVTCDVPLSAVG